MQRIANSKSSFNYEILDTYEAGLVLQGSEVKSIRQGHATINDAFIAIENNELFLVKAHIAPYQIKNQVGYDPYHARKLLVSKKQFLELARRKNEAGLTLIPLALYDTHGLIKLSFALVRGKKKHDKRETIKRRDAKREMDRVMKTH